MKAFFVVLDDVAAAFYARLAERLALPVERVLADALFKLAGELSLEALANSEKKQSGS